MLAGSFEAIETAIAQGARFGHGRHLEGELHPLQSREFLLKRKVMPSIDVVACATVVNAEILGQGGRLGVIAPGATADILVLEGDPLNEVGSLADPDRCLKVIMKDGRIYRNVL